MIHSIADAPPASSAEPQSGLGPAKPWGSTLSDSAPVIAPSDFCAVALQPVIYIRLLAVELQFMKSIRGLAQSPGFLVSSSWLSRVNPVRSALRYTEASGNYRSCLLGYHNCFLSSTNLGIRKINSVIVNTAVLDTHPRGEASGKGPR